ncbi:hypothetical protein B481_1855 [Planococcus halocryophilus Or1]|nr:hypothetical protein B481_1855 [Planococcus halocryophilus Or1]
MRGKSAFANGHEKMRDEEEKTKSSRKAEFKDGSIVARQHLVNIARLY